MSIIFSTHGFRSQIFVSLLHAGVEKIPWQGACDSLLALFRVNTVAFLRQTAQFISAGKL